MAKTTATERKTLTEINETIEMALGKIADAKTQLETLKDERTEFFDSKSEKWQESDNGTEYSEFTDNCETAFEELETAENELGTIRDTMQNLVNEME